MSTNEPALLAKTDRRLTALTLVGQGQIRQIVASGCYWKDSRGQTLERGMGMTLTVMYQKGLIVTSNHAQVRRVSLTDKGKNTLAYWRTQR